MKNQIMALSDKLLLRKRAIIESVNNQFKNCDRRNISQTCCEPVEFIEHIRHRSLANITVNLVSGLIAYLHQPKKPSLRIRRHSIR